MKKTPEKQFVEYLIQLRDERGLTQKEIAAKLGVQPGYMSEVFNGRKPSGKLAAAIRRLHKQVLIDGEGATGGKAREAVDLEALLGQALTDRARNEASRRGFESVADYVKYLTRADVEAHPVAEMREAVDLARGLSEIDDDESL